MASGSVGDSAVGSALIGTALDSVAGALAISLAEECEVLGSCKRAEVGRGSVDSAGITEGCPPGSARMLRLDKLKAAMTAMAGTATIADAIAIRRVRCGPCSAIRRAPMARSRIVAPNDGEVGLSRTRAHADSAIELFGSCAATLRSNALRSCIRSPSSRFIH